MPVRKWLGGAVMVALAIQLVPYGRDHTNPPVGREPAWDSAETRDTFLRSCGDCHSNQTVWPWYSHVAPISWLVTHDVEDGRKHFNVSDWDRPRQDGDEAVEVVSEGEMPPWFYLPMHPEADLSAPEKERFLEGLERTFPPGQDS